MEVSNGSQDFDYQNDTPHFQPYKMTMQVIVQDVCLLVLLAIWKMKIKTVT